jgi:hypothetical protein
MFPHYSPSSLSSEREGRRDFHTGDFHHEPHEIGLRIVPTMARTLIPALMPCHCHHPLSCTLAKQKDRGKGKFFSELVTLGWLQMGAGTPATNFLFLDNMVRAAELLDDAERADIAEDVKVRDPTSFVHWVIYGQSGCVCV